MAHLDPDTGRLSLQVVYDGAPLSGKTSSVVALGRLLGSPVITPEEDRGRTVYFDWMDYAGGLCRGRPIQCRVIAVPGQDELVVRRRMITRAADVVLFVVDTSAASFPGTRERFDALQTLLSLRSREIPVLLQLNKRDADDALPVEAVLDRLDPNLETIESVAITGDGIREAFVLAVGASVRRLRKSGYLYDPKLCDPKLCDTQEVQMPNPEALQEWLEHA